MFQTNFYLITNVFLSWIQFGIQKIKNNADNFDLTNSDAFEPLSM